MANTTHHQTNNSGAFFPHLNAIVNQGTPKITLKLIINKDTQKLLFAEAGKDFIDFLFSIPSIPLACIHGLRQDGMAETGLLNLFKTIENFDDNYIYPSINKTDLLSHVTPIRDRLYASNNVNPNLNSPNASSSIFHNPAVMVNNQNIIRHSGFVRGTGRYMIMDDLNVEPMSVISSVLYLEKIGALDSKKLEEREVAFGEYEAVKLLKESMVTKEVLSSVFLDKKMEREEDFAIVNQVKDSNVNYGMNAFSF